MASSLSLDLAHTLAVAGPVLLAGHGIRRALPRLAHANIPAPVIGGLMVATALWVLRTREDGARLLAGLKLPPA
jgi:ESS family glutamate:Na+ symporter